MVLHMVRNYDEQLNNFLAVGQKVHSCDSLESITWVHGGHMIDATEMRDGPVRWVTNRDYCGIILFIRYVRLGVCIG